MLSYLMAVKLLGTFLDFELTREVHADYITRKLLNQLYLFSIYCL